MSEKPTLSYFSSRGKAEGIRLVLAEAQVDYEEKHLGPFNPANQPQDFLDLKASGVLDFGSVPLWKEGDFMLVQSYAIIRHIARKHGLYGSSIEEASLIDCLHDGLDDAKTPIANKIRSATPETRATVFKEILTVDLPKWFKYFEQFITKHGKDGFAVGSKISYVDISLYYLIDTFAENGASFESFPILKAHYEKIKTRPNIAAYINNPKRFPAQKYV